MQRDVEMLALRHDNPEAWSAVVRRSLETLGRALSGSGWLVGDGFTVADLNVAGVLSPSHAGGLDFIENRDVSEWLARCYDRPAAREVRRKFAA
jgi:glutathione S-transferase